MKTDNELVAEFMGFTPYANGKWWNVPKGEDLKYRAFKIDISKLEYSTSWDWLMPVVEKISNLHTKHRLRGKICANDPHHPADEIFCLHLMCDIKRAYEAVVEFIKWYNSQQK